MSMYSWEHLLLLEFKKKGFGQTSELYYVDIVEYSIYDGNTGQAPICSEFGTDKTLATDK